MKPKSSTNLFLLAVAVIVFGLIVNAASTTSTVVAVAFCVSLLIALCGAIVKSVENKREGRESNEA